MADNNNTINPKNPLSAAQSTGTQVPAKPGALFGKNEEIGQKQFLTLLVHQLQNQDPLNPMDNQEFAVQLAQFSQLEQLIQIKDKLGDGADALGSVGSMASFLGHEVVLKGDTLSIHDNQGPNLLVDVPAGSSSLRVDLTDENNKVVASKVFEGLAPGKQKIKLSDLGVSDGSYGMRTVVVGNDGRFNELQAKITGTVEGFVVEPEPALLVNGEHVSLADVTEVYLGKDNQESSAG